MNRIVSSFLLVAIAALAAMAVGCGGGDGGYPLGPGPTPTPNPTPVPTPNTFDVNLVSVIPTCGSDASFGTIVEAVISYTSSSIAKVSFAFIFEGDQNLYTIGMDGSASTIPAGSGIQKVRGMIDFQRVGKGSLFVILRPVGGGEDLLRKDVGCYFNFK